MSKNLISKAVGSDRMLYDPIADAVHILNPTAQAVLDLHREGLDEAAIAETLRERFQIPEGQPVLEDVRTCLQRLRDQGVLDS